VRIDNSAANDFRVCPWLYYEKHLKEGTGLEKIYQDEKIRPIDLGSRVHELLEEHYREMQGNPRVPYPVREAEDLENEAQVIMAGYRKRYPFEDFEILDVEKTFEVALPDYCPTCYKLETVKQNVVREGYLFCEKCDQPDFPRGRHTYVGKIDLFYRLDGELYIMDHKTEKRSSKSNLPQKWAARDQGTQYLWAAEQVYGQSINRFLINILRRPSEKGQVGPEFPDRMRIERTEIQIETALRDLVYTADQIEKMKVTFGDKPWPAHRENCFTWSQCEFYMPHLYGWSEAIRELRYQPKKPYLDFGGVQVIQP